MITAQAAGGDTKGSSDALLICVSRFKQGYHRIRLSGAVRNVVVREGDPMNENDALRFLGAEINMMVDPNDPRRGRVKLDKVFL